MEHDECGRNGRIDSPARCSSRSWIGLTAAANTEGSSLLGRTVNGKETGGFAFVAYPREYGNSDVMLHDQPGWRAAPKGSWKGNNGKGNGDEGV